jgi:replicative DNA helicase
MGKSAWMLNACENMSRRGIPTLYFSLEMPANELASRVVLGRAETNIEVVRNGFLDHAASCASPKPPTNLPASPSTLMTAEV